MGNCDESAAVHDQSCGGGFGGRQAPRQRERSRGFLQGQKFRNEKIQFKMIFNPCEFRDMFYVKGIGVPLRCKHIYIDIMRLDQRFWQGVISIHRDRSN
ncbi:MAG: hypothetical protein PHQ81_00345 [Methanofollis sp.]|nr:hypothetical protein [Methanofollis sp.]